MSPVNPTFIRDRMKRYKERGGASKQFGKLGEGKNVLRVLPFDHKANAFDVIAKRYPEDAVGKIHEEWFCDVTRLWPMGAPFKNCLPTEEECPIWQEYWNRAKDQREGYKPKPIFVVNAVNMLEPHRGVQLYTLSSAIFIGERNVKQEKVGIGIYDIYAGYDPKEGKQETDEEVEGFGGKVGVSLPNVPAWGDKLLGLRGRDIVIFMKAAPGDQKGLRINNGMEHGGIVLRKDSEVLGDQYLRGVKDLYMQVDLYPGYCQRDQNLWKHADDFINFVKAETGEDVDDKGQPAEAKKDPVDEDVVSPFAAPDEVTKTEVPASAPVTEPKKRGRKPKAAPTEAGPKIERGVKVIVVDRWNEDNTKLLPAAKQKRYVATFDRWDQGENGTTEGWVHLKPEDQTDEELKANVQSIVDGTEESEIRQGGVFSKFNKDDIEAHTG